MSAVSVIIPVYRVEPYVARCARSLFGQTLEDIEFIFVDDCSPDRSIDIIKEVLADYPNRKEQVLFVRTPHNGGLAKARVFGLKYAKGDYIIHCDSDDAVVPDAYRLMYEKAVAENLDIVTCDYQVLGVKKPHVQSQFSVPGREIGDILIGKVWSTVWSRMSRRCLWDGIIVPRADMWEDMVFTIQTISRAKRIGYIQKPLYLYYRRSGSISASPGVYSSIRRWTSQVANAEQVIGFLSNAAPTSWDSSDLIVFKYSSRGPLSTWLHVPQVYHRWRETFPEVDWAIFRSGISLKAKFDYCLICLHVSHPYRRIRSILRVVYYRVFHHCTPPVCNPKPVS